LSDRLLEISKIQHEVLEDATKAVTLRPAGTARCAVGEVERRTDETL